MVNIQLASIANVTMTVRATLENQTAPKPGHVGGLGIRALRLCTASVA